MEIKPTYVTFEQAKKLKEKGFDIFLNKAWIETFEHTLDCGRGDIITFPHQQPRILENRHTDHSFIHCMAPEQWQVVEWLRVNYGIFVYTYMCGMDFFCYRIQSKGLQNSIIKNSYGSSKDTTGMFNSPQEAYSAAFDYILKELI